LRNTSLGHSALDKLGHRIKGVISRSALAAKLNAAPSGLARLAKLSG
jgi:hypothetical protein